MKSLREQFEEEYAAISVPANNKNGFSIQYIYYAPWYIWDLPQKKLKIKKIKYTGISIGSLFLYLLVGVQNIELNCFKPVEIMALLALCAHVLELFAVLQFCFANYRTTRMTFKNVDIVLRTATILRGCFLIGTVISGMSFLLRNSYNALTICVLIGYFICACVSFCIFAEYRKIPFKTEKNNSLQDVEKVL